MNFLILSLLVGDPVSIPAPVILSAQPAPRLVMTYRTIYERVTGGQVVFLSVGSDEPGYERVDDAPPVVKPGLYRCYVKDGVPTFERVEPVRKAVQFMGKAMGRVAEVCLPGRP